MSGKAVKRASLEIRACRVEDAAEVGRILNESPEAARWSCASLEAAAGHSGEEFLIARLNGQLAGFVVGSTLAGEAEILNLAVKAAFRRAGVGGSLVRALLKRYAETGVGRVFLEVRESNRGAIALYEWLGFRQVGRRERYYRDPAEGALVLAKDLRRRKSTGQVPNSS
jgi:ribosomal-protein-alanine acetyltransferase